MKTIKFYFGKKAAGVFGMENPDIIDIEIKDEIAVLTVEKLTGNNPPRWVIVEGKNKTIYVNTQNILWFEIVDVLEFTRKPEEHGHIADISKIAPIGTTDKTEAADE